MNYNDDNKNDSGKREKEVPRQYLYQCASSGILHLFPSGL